MKKFVFTAILWCLILVVTLASSEVVLRLWPGVWNQPNNTILDVDVGPWSKANYSTDYRSADFHVKDIHWNRHGMRDRSRNEKKPPGNFRIGILGDSFIEGMQVTDELTISRRLEEMLSENLKAVDASSIEVLNFGKSSLGTVAEYLVYLHKARSFDLDVVVLGFLVANDVRNNSRALQKIYKDNDTGGSFVFAEKTKTGEYEVQIPPPTNRTFRHALHDHLALYRFWRYARDYRISQESQDDNPKTPMVISTDAKTSPLPFTGQNVGYGVYVPDVSKEWSDAWHITEWAIDELNQAITQDGAQLVIMIIPSAYNRAESSDRLEDLIGRPLPSNFDWDLPAQRLAEFSRSRLIPVLDLTEGMRRHATEVKMSYPWFSWDNDGHWNPMGHELAASLLHEFLCEKELLPKPCNGDGATIN